MAHAFTVKCKSKRWPLAMFYNIIDLSTIAAKVIWQAKLPTNELSHGDNRQLFIIAVARELILPHVQRRASIPTLNLPIKRNIDTVLTSLLPTPPRRASASNPQNPGMMVLHSPRSTRDVPSVLRKDRKTKICCPKCNRFICKDHTVIMSTNCSI
ncbi:hypothetical protein RRG08_043263 [Elysia crispata]|uniref:PiggyBac transposable element-derived protein domain-containing protein n=1 Tax=Elysia crispata TaxID=231223 RepID=A0AAE0XY06_9GAST|nr:hypothetical protein RRG08_043263 [Elysia crispata]